MHLSTIPMIPIVGYNFVPPIIERSILLARSMNSQHFYAMCDRIAQARYSRKTVFSFMQQEMDIAEKNGDRRE